VGILSKGVFMKKMLYFLITLLVPHLDQVYASSLGVWPINPRIDPPASAVMVWVKNNSKTESVTLQARVFLWRQVDNKDQLLAQDELVISPPIIEVKAEAQQIFRIISRQGAIQNTHEEKSYRLLIDEIPSEEKIPNSILRFQMRYSLPLFVGLPKSLENLNINERLTTMASGLSYRVIQEPQPFLEIYNKNMLHARLSNVSIINQEKTAKPFVISDGLLGYVLPNSVRQWPLTNEQFIALNHKSTMLKFEQEHQELAIASEK
jgi:fimbrial chaperone protein